MAGSIRTGLSLCIQRGRSIARLPAGESTLRRWVRTAHAAHGVKRARARTIAMLTLRCVGRGESAALNERYRGRDYATNVLTFVYGTSADIVLCLPVIRSEARAYGIPLRDHLAHMVVHGVLHAGGATHDSRGTRARMESLESAILTSLGLTDPWRDEPHRRAAARSLPD